MTRRILIALFALVLMAMPLVAQEPAASSPAAFVIERIEVRNAKRVSQEVVIAESRLREGNEYSEAELSDAANRLARLPYLLSAEFSLEKGSERGRYILVITIAEAHRFFYALDIRPILEGRSSTVVDYGDRIGVGNSEIAVGWRHFVGRRGAFHIGLMGSDLDHDFVDDYGSVAVGYTHYDLFGTRAFATLNLKQVFGTYGGNAHYAISPELVVGIPLSLNQTLTVQLTNTRLGEEERTVRVPIFDDEPPFEIEEFRIPVSDSQRLVSSTWSYNTTNRPFLPTRGTLLTVTPLVAWNDAASYAFLSTGPPPSGQNRVEPYTTHSRTDSIKVSGSRYWELSPRQSLLTGLESNYARLERRSEFLGHSEAWAWRGFATLGVSHSLWDPSRDKEGDSRLEANLRLGLARQEDERYRFADREQEIDYRQVSASWVRRSSWGTLRLGLGYAW